MLKVKLDVLDGQAHDFITLEALVGRGPGLEKAEEWARAAFGI